MPNFKHQNGLDRVENGAEWTATCANGFGAVTDVPVRKCIDNKLSPDLESVPVSCVKGWVIFSENYVRNLSKPWC